MRSERGGGGRREHVGKSCEEREKAGENILLRVVRGGKQERTFW